MAPDEFAAFLDRTFEATKRSPAEVVSTDALDPMDDGEFDDALWLALCGRISSVDDLGRFPAGVRMYFATRLFEWEVGNGGIEQAVDNAGDFLDEAVAGYRLLCDEAMAELVGRVSEASTDADALELLEAEVDGPPWLGTPTRDGERIAWVRAHREDFT